ncbi:Mob1/phocein [Dendryphion nanum]|uniref:Mob1/phocein n=1 Tax=Dendryphion nanum TaxID=256645 RepID=A0A9P9IIW8_9PLEO|nr:Mob1/phocein [Dendryphion nanum]
MAASTMSPVSSPRLPSPPPIAEDQLGPKSPLPASEQKFLGNIDHGASRRIRPGTKAEDMAEGPPLVDLSEIDSAFQLTEHLKALHNFLTHPTGSNTTIPVDRNVAEKLAQPPDNVDKTLWLYELCRFLIQKVNIIVVALFSDNPPCSAQTCAEMRASEWQYLCAVHDPPKSCCAIDYCCHTLDWAANTLTSPKTFPSRLALGNDQTTQHQQIRNLTNIFRRVYRIFAHAWFEHREIFWRVEGRTGLYILFKTVCNAYGLIPEDNFTIPPEAEGETNESMAETNLPPRILKREPSNPGLEDTGSSSIIEGVSEHSLSTAGTTKRHRHSPSVGATAVTTVVEENEEEDSQAGKQPTSLEAHFSISEPTAEETATTSDESKADDNSSETAEANNAAEAAVAASAAEASPAPAPTQEESEKQSVSADADNKAQDEDDPVSTFSTTEKAAETATSEDASSASEIKDESEEGEIVEPTATTTTTAAASVEEDESGVAATELVPKASEEEDKDSTPEKAEKDPAPAIPAASTATAASTTTSATAETIDNDKKAATTGSEEGVEPGS